VVAGPVELPNLSQSIEIAARRDESTRRTFYELRVPKVLFRYGPDFYWDLFINENDGQGRAGALQMASATWGAEETQIGSLRGPGRECRAGTSGLDRKREGADHRPAPHADSPTTQDWLKQRGLPRRRRRAAFGLPGGSGPAVTPD